MPGITTILSSFWMAIVLLIVHLFLFTSTEVYWEMPGVDSPLHVLGGIVLGHGFLSYLKILAAYKVVIIKGKLLTLSAVLSFVTTVAVVWEFHEYILQNWTGIIMQPSIADTMKDLFLGMMGALLSMLMFYKPKK